MYFDGMSDCSKGNINRQSLKTVVKSRVVLYCIFKNRKIGLTLRKRGWGGGGGGDQLTLSVIRSIFRRVPNITKQYQVTNLFISGEINT